MAKTFENVEETKRMHAKEAYTTLHRATISLLPVLREDQVVWKAQVCDWTSALARLTLP